MWIKKKICECCGNEIPNYKQVNFDFVSLLNNKENFKDMVTVCPNCGYAMLFSITINDDIKECICSEYYQAVFKSNELDPLFKNWILLAFICEIAQKPGEAGVAYRKAFDYLELNGKELDKPLLFKAAQLFLASGKKTGSFSNGIMTTDCLRRFGNLDQAKEVISLLKKDFKSEIEIKLINMEENLINENNTSFAILN